MKKLLSLNINLHKINKLFDNLAIDKYCKDGYRYKEIIRYKKIKNTFFETSHDKFYDSIKDNQTKGGIIRDYKKIKSCNQLENIANIFFKETNIKEGEVLLQVQRIMCLDKNKEYYPIIERIQQDGTEYMSIFCVNRENISGGISKIFTSNNTRNMSEEYEIKPNEMLILDDNKYWHYVTPIKVLDEKKRGYIDTIIISQCFF